MKGESGGGWGGGGGEGSLWLLVVGKSQMGGSDINGHGEKFEGHHVPLFSDSCRPSIFPFLN